MKEYFRANMAETPWLIFERDWDPDRQGAFEAMFTLGNGYVGSRGVLEELPLGCSPGTYFAGLYDTTGAQVTELINSPNPFCLSVAVGGEKLDVTAMQVLGHSRILDMKRGLLARRTLYSSTTAGRFDYRSIRFVSLRNRHIAVMKVSVTPLDRNVELTIDSYVDCSVTNKGLVTEGRKRHFHIAAFQKIGHVNYICTKTLEREILIAYASQIRVAFQDNARGRATRRRRIVLKATKGQSLFVTLYFSFHTSRETDSRQIQTRAVRAVEQAAKRGFRRLLDEHSRAWAEKWRVADIEIRGDRDAERALRFNTYHLMIAANEADPRVSVCAKGLSGEGYRGHVFWDTEIFIFPFFLYTNPQAARSLLLYRYHGLPAAREKAREHGFQGAMFPWEAADTGADVTPTWHKDFDGRVIQITTNRYQHHITADIAYAVCQYYYATGDVEFLLKNGLEILLEAARFWAGRVEFNAQRRRFEIRHVTGPDEFHEDVDNNAYTNVMGKWTLAAARGLLSEMKRRHRIQVTRLCRQLGMRDKEFGEWKRIEASLWIPRNNAAGVIESFEGYSKRKKFPLPKTKNDLLPGFPERVPISKLGTTQFLKQPDVVMLLFLLSDHFDRESMLKNYRFYEARTLHKSSLSPSIHAILAADLGESDLAYHYFRIAAYTDLKDLYDNTMDGLHMAAMGGAWQAAVCGFGGLRIRDQLLSFDPHLPPRWKKLVFQFWWQCSLVRATIEQNTIELVLQRAASRKGLEVVVYGQRARLLPRRSHVFNRKHAVSARAETTGGY